MHPWAQIQGASKCPYPCTCSQWASSSVRGPASGRQVKEVTWCLRLAMWAQIHTILTRKRRERSSLKVLLCTYLFIVCVVGCSSQVTACVGQRTTWRSHFFPSTIWVLGTDSGQQPWPQVPFLWPEPSHQPKRSFIQKFPYLWLGFHCIVLLKEFPFKTSLPRFRAVGSHVSSSVHCW